MPEDIINKALNAKKESKSIEFKASLDIASPGEWCEIIKDVVAMANSGGGVILIGVNDKGHLSKFNVSKILKLDHADLVTKFNKYTGVNFSDIEIIELTKRSRKIAAFIIKGVSIPLIFIRPGTYDIGGGKQKTAFGQGTIYFRHGAKSEHGTSDDLRRSLERELNRIRKEWVNGVRKVVAAPRESEVVVVSKEVKESKASNAIPIRIVDDLTAPVYRKIDPDESHPFRQKEILLELNKRLPENVKVNAYDILCLGRLYKFQNNPAYFYRSRFGSPQYSEELVKWIVDQYKKENNFFDNARRECFQKRFELGITVSKNKKHL